MRSKGYCTWFVCLCVSVSTYSRPTGTKPAHQQYQRLSRNKGSKSYVAILLKWRRLRDMALKQGQSHLPPRTATNSGSVEHGQIYDGAEGFAL